jgi:hypothetical protein
MNFTTLEHIQNIINEGAIYWTLRDRNNSAILAEQNNAVAPSDSYDRLTRVLNNMRGEFVKLTLSQRAPSEKGTGGNVKNYGPFNIEIQGVTNAPALIGAPPANYGGRDFFNDWINERDKRQNLEMEILRRDMDDNNNKLLKEFGPAIFGLVNKFIEPNTQTAANVNTPEQISAAPYTFQVADETTAQNLTTLASKPKFAEVLNMLVIGGDDAWDTVLTMTKLK